MRLLRRKAVFFTGLRRLLRSSVVIAPKIDNFPVGLERRNGRDQVSFVEVLKRYNVNTRCNISGAETQQNSRDKEIQKEQKQQLRVLLQTCHCQRV